MKGTNPNGITLELFDPRLLIRMECSGSPIQTWRPPPRVAGLLAGLALQQNMSASREALVPWIWPDGQTPHEVKSGFRAALYTARKAFANRGYEQVIVERGGELSLNLERHSVDVLKLEDWIRGSLGSNDSEALTEAISLWNLRPILAKMPGHKIDESRTRFYRLLYAALNMRANGFESVGDYPRTEYYLVRLLELVRISGSRVLTDSSSTGGHTRIGSALYAEVSERLTSIRQKANRAVVAVSTSSTGLGLRKYSELCRGLGPVQAGWEDHAFGERHVRVTVRRERFTLCPELASTARDPRAGNWEYDGLKDNEQVGVARVDVSDTDNIRSGLIHIDAHRYQYFDALATNFTHGDIESPHKELIDAFIPSSCPDPLHPIMDFPNPLSVGLTMFCEGGNCLVLTVRSTKRHSGGHLQPGTLFNAVGENVNMEDAAGTSEDLRLVSPWHTAARALHREMGWPDADVRRNPPILHTFTYDANVLDYKFFGYVVTPISREEVEYFWERAKERNESSRSPLFLDISSEAACLEVCRMMRRSLPGKWSREAVFSTVESLRLFRHIERERIHTAFAPD